MSHVKTGVHDDYKAILDNDQVRLGSSEARKRIPRKRID